MPATPHRIAATSPLQSLPASSFQPVTPRWVDIAPALFAGEPQSGGKRERLWLLVLQAKGIPYTFSRHRGLPSLLVPATAEKKALSEILAFENEVPPMPPPVPAPQYGSYWYAALLTALIPWHRIRWDGFTLSGMPASAEAWVRHAGLDTYRVTKLHELWRSVTSLTLHSDGAHLMSNVVMGSLFGIPLCRYTGVGFGFLLTILGGAIGNIATAFCRKTPALSQGFSTAVFASIGLLAVFAAMRAARHAHAEATRKPSMVALKSAFIKGITPICAGLGFLAMLGGSGAPNVDYLAHVLGFFAGGLLGLAMSFLFPELFELQGKTNMVFQSACLVAAMAIIGACWAFAR